MLSSLTNCPEKCELLYDPVCGSNGRTYKTTCHLELDNCFGKKEKVLAVHKGECLAKEEDEAEPYKLVRRNMQLSQRSHLTTTTRIQFVFLFLFSFCIPNGVKITMALISMRQGKPEGFWYLKSNGVIMKMCNFR